LAIIALVVICVMLRKRKYKRVNNPAGEPITQAYRAEPPGPITMQKPETYPAASGAPYSDNQEKLNFVGALPSPPTPAPEYKDVNAIHNAPPQPQYQTPYPQATELTGSTTYTAYSPHPQPAVPVPAAAPYPTHSPPQGYAAPHQPYGTPQQGAPYPPHAQQHGYEMGNIAPQRPGAGSGPVYELPSGPP
jgi:hypothetical protein